MSNTADIKKLKSSWTKYDIVKLVDIDSVEDIREYISGSKSINESVLRAYLGVEKLSDPLPTFWKEIEQHPRFLRLFALIAAITTHYSIVEKMGSFANKGNMNGTYLYESKKEFTNLRSALVVSGAALQKDRRSEKVPYTFSRLFENGEIGLIIRSLLENRLLRIGFTKAELANKQVFYQECYKANFISALTLKRGQFKKWVDGEALDIKDEVFSIQKLKAYSEIPMLRVNQWMNEWDDIDFNLEELRRKPKPYFYTFSIDARLLKRLSDVHARSTDRTSPQRRRSDRRVQEISGYIEGGFPWSTLSEEQQKMEEHNRLKMPGLLPTAIILNILSPGEERNGKQVKSEDCLIIDDQMKNPEEFDSKRKELFPILKIPERVFDEQWAPEVKPIEIIDGQHRLWAFDEEQNFSGNYELPVIAFENLDRAWQAYLFYTINIKPVRINTSLGFDLYPMLRTQKWLEASKDGVLAYRESRAQELVELLWRYPESPWHNRINMLGESGGLTISQSAFVRTLINSFFRQTKGMYASNFNRNGQQVLHWNRAQQAAFLILIWQAIKDALANAQNLEWANKIRGNQEEVSTDLAFTGKDSFLSRDQGVRPIMIFTNDYFFTLMDESRYSLNKFVWTGELDERVVSDESIDLALEIFREDENFIELINAFAQIIIQVDWRTPSARFNNEEERRQQSIYRGSGGYSEYYAEIKKVFQEKGDEFVKNIVNQIQ